MKASKLGSFVWGLLDQARWDIQEHGYTTMDRNRIKELIYGYFRDKLDEDERWRLERSKLPTENDLEGELYGISDAADRVQEELEKYDLKRVSPQVEEYLKEKAINDIQPDSIEFKTLAYEMLKAQYCLFEIITARIEGNFKREAELKQEYLEKILRGGEAASPVSAPDNDKTTGAGTRLSETIEIFLDEKKRGEITKRSLNDLTYSLQLFKNFTGDPKTDEISYETMRNYFERLKNWPSNKEKKKQYRDKTLEELATMEIPTEDRISLSTLNKHLVWVKRDIVKCCGWGVPFGLSHS